MSAINWNEITNRAYAFVKEHEDMSSERSEAIVFWRDLLEVFGVKASLRNLFEHAVANLKGHYSRIDMFWEGVVLVEHKSRGKDLTRAESQAFSYIQDLARTEPHKIPRYVILCDFANFLLYDLTQEPIEDHVRSFPLEDLPKHVKDFGFFINVDADRPLEQEDLNLKAVELLGSLHDVIEDAKYPREHLDTYMMRLLFCLFADDTGILNHQMERVLQDCNPDGAETGRIMQEMFDVLNTAKEARQSTMDSVLRELEYINGGLFNEHLPLLYYSREMHQKLLECTRFDWGLISPVV
ncbi:MAG TPA: class I SAM-dependent DNA methyltransferase, partial [Spirochaetota bacterium]|nr:class I SAM-dependent DNA methyltransferase [Spirochaetota bacterium]